MDLHTYISIPERRQALADELQTAPVYLWQIATAWRGKRASWSMAKRIEAATEKLGPEKVSKESLRPDVFGPASGEAA